METIVRSTKDENIVILAQAQDSLRRKIQYIRIVAWAIGPDYAIPITALGRAEPNGPWAVAGSNGFVTSEGMLFETSNWLEQWLLAKVGAAA